jgi:hypothetical protein
MQFKCPRKCKNIIVVFSERFASAQHMQLKVLCSHRSSRITKQHPLPCPLSEPSVVPQPQPAAPIVPVPSSTKRLLEMNEEKDQPTISIRKPRTDLDEDFQQGKLLICLLIMIETDHKCTLSQISMSIIGHLPLQSPETMKA